MTAASMGKRTDYLQEEDEAIHSDVIYNYSLLLMLFNNYLSDRTSRTRVVVVLPL